MFVFCMNVMNGGKRVWTRGKKDMTGLTARIIRNDLTIVNMGP